MYEASPLRDVERIGLGQPHVTVNSRAFVEPSFALRRVYAHHQDILSAVVEEVRNIVEERSVPAHIPPDELAVKDHHAVAEDAVELDRQPLAKIARGDVEHSPVPADARRRVIPIQRLEAVID